MKIIIEKILVKLTNLDPKSTDLETLRLTPITKTRGK